MSTGPDASTEATPTQGSTHPGTLAPHPGTLLPIEVPGPWRSIGHRLRHLADATPDAPALVSAGQSFSYAEMLHTATGWARSISAELAEEPGGRPVALVMHAEARTIVAFFAVILSGRPVVPLDPVMPPRRLDQIVASSGALRMTAGEIDGLPGAADVVLPEARGEDPAVIFYTSGSTGTPKGLVHSHQAWLNQAFGFLHSLELTPGDRNALVLPLSFGAGLDVLFMSVLNGSSAHAYDPRTDGLTGMFDWFRRQRVTTVHGTPSLLRAMADAMPSGSTLAGVRLVTSCGEPIHATLINDLRARMEPDATFVGLSGASEVGSLAVYPIPAAAAVPPGMLPVGRPAANRTIEVIGDDGRPLGPGRTGQVVITSAYISSGYHDNPAMTAEKFRRNDDGTTTYTGGDLGQWDEHGFLHLKGRADTAVKIGGYLVEPAEVEAALLDAPEVREAVVSVVPAQDGARARLVAHVVPVAADKPTTPAAVRRMLRERLPTWMVPADVVMMTALPRNERGKVERPALPPVAPSGRPGRPGTPTASSTEVLLSRIWQAVLRLPEVGADDDFWALGADSLCVEEMIAAVQQETGVELSSSDLVGAPTIGELARLLDQRRNGRRPVTRELPPTALVLREGAAGPPVFAFAGGGSSALALHPIATSLAADVPFVGFHAAGYDSRALPDWRLRDVARRHLKVIAARAPHGPYVLIGHSFGGIVALETAARLRAAGHQVPLVVLLDTVLPGAGDTAQTGGTGDAVATAPPLRERMLMHARLLGAGLIRYRPEVRDAVFWEQSLRMANRHSPVSWPGRTLVFTTRANLSDPARWDRVLTGEREVIRVDGGHSSILRPPFNPPIVERLDDELAALTAGTEAVGDGSAPAR